MKKGQFIVLDGGEGGGKTTVSQLLGDALLKEGYDVLLTREPGGIPSAEEMRAIIMHPTHNLDIVTEAYLFAAARREHLVKKVRPHLEKGGIVICDRFLASSLVYQGIVKGLGVEKVLAINSFAVEDIAPDATFILDIAPQDALARIAANELREKNRFDLESLTFHEQIRAGYLQIAKEQLIPNYFIVDARPSPDIVAQQIRSHLTDL